MKCGNATVLAHPSRLTGPHAELTSREDVVHIERRHGGMLHVLLHVRPVFWFER